MDKFSKYDVSEVATEWVARNLSGLSVPVLRGRQVTGVALDQKVLVLVLGHRQTTGGGFFVVAQDPSGMPLLRRDDHGVKLYADPVEGAGYLTAMYAWRFREHPAVASMFEGGVPAVDASRFPHKCGCGAPAYRGFNAIECSASGCRGRW